MLFVGGALIIHQDLTLSGWDPSTATDVFIFLSVCEYAAEQTVHRQLYFDVSRCIRHILLSLKYRRN